MKSLRLAALALAVSLSACKSMPGSESDINAVLAASGLESQLAWLRQPLQEDRTSGPLALIPDDWIRVVNATVAETVKPGDIRGALYDEMKKSLSGSELAQVRRFYESDVGRKVVAVEGGRLQGRTGSAALNDATLDALASATGLGKAVSLLAENALGDAVDIALKTGCLGEQPGYAKLLGGVMKKAQLLALRNAVNDSIRERYASLSSQEQSMYLDFARSGAGQKFFSTRTTVLNDFAQKAGNMLGAQLTPRINEVCKPSA
jgi:uncharacterized protein YdbL (DUF1318 family)